MTEKPVRVRTIAELAKIAGVTSGTVSRALSGSPLVKERTREHILALAREYDFRPNQMASRLRMQRTGVIGVVVPLGHEKRQHLSDPFFMAMLGALADALTENGHDIMLSRVIPDTHDWLERIVDSGMLDGVLLIGQSDQMDAIERVAQRYRPLVAWGAVLPGMSHCAVGTDNLAGGKLAAGHLIERGAKRLAFLGEIRAPEIRARYDGACAAAAAYGLAAPIQLKAHLASDIMGREVARRIGEMAQDIDGIVAATDLLAMNAIRVLADRAIDVPARVRVIGYDDLPLAEQTVPRLSTIRQDIVRGARAMVDALFRRIADEDTPSLELPPKLVVRDSS
ncbi:MAG: LacI family transcriptional regulator [Sphingomonas sp.]|nr:MAG: LacI family transcriptional regulator [Sphingomonas sp.]